MEVTYAEVYFCLHPRVDIFSLISLEAAQVISDYYKSYACDLASTRVYRDVLISFIGRMQYSVLGAKIADISCVGGG
jgi:hypothetical protein